MNVFDKMLNGVQISVQVFIVQINIFKTAIALEKSVLGKG